MENELFEPLEWPYFFIFITVVDFFEITYDLLATAEEADLLNIKKQEQVKLHTFLELDPKLLQNKQHFQDKVNSNITNILKLMQLTDSSTQIFPLDVSMFDFTSDSGDHVDLDFFKF